MLFMRRRGRVHALDVERCRGLSAVPRSPLPSPAASNRIATGTGTAPMRYGCGGDLSRDAVLA